MVRVAMGIRCRAEGTEGTADHRGIDRRSMASGRRVPLRQRSRVLRRAVAQPRRDPSAWNVVVHIKRRQRSEVRDAYRGFYFVDCRHRRWARRGIPRTLRIWSSVRLRLRPVRTCRTGGWLVWSVVQRGLAAIARGSSDERATGRYAGDTCCARAWSNPVGLDVGFRRAT